MPRLGLGVLVFGRGNLHPSTIKGMQDRKALVSGAAAHSQVEHSTLGCSTVTARADGAAQR